MLTFWIICVILTTCLDYINNPQSSGDQFMAARLTNKTAFITGGNSGIGLATARLFLAEGARVALTGRNPQTLAEAAEALGHGVLPIQADATDAGATERAIARVVE